MHITYCDSASVQIEFLVPWKQVYCYYPVGSKLCEQNYINFVHPSITITNANLEFLGHRYVLIMQCYLHWAIDMY